MGLAMQDDLNDALGFAVKEGWADGKRACLMGGSYGGYATMWGLARIPICGVAAFPWRGFHLRRDVNDMRSYLNMPDLSGRLEEDDA
jgi:dipeptidyl aminopeptidase/acylaminoacyl peptidase